jgi:hypothetical protein
MQYMYQPPGLGLGQLRGSKNIKNWNCLLAKTSSTFMFPVHRCRARDAAVHSTRMRVLLRTFEIAWYRPRVCHQNHLRGLSALSRGSAADTSSCCHVVMPGSGHDIPRTHLLCIQDQTQVPYKTRYCVTIACSRSHQCLPQSESFPSHTLYRESPQL